MVRNSRLEGDHDDDPVQLPSTILQRHRHDETYMIRSENIAISVRQRQHRRSERMARLLAREEQNVIQSRKMIDVDEVNTPQPNRWHKLEPIPAPAPDKDLETEDKMLIGSQAYFRRYAIIVN